MAIGDAESREMIGIYCEIIATRQKFILRKDQSSFSTDYLMAFGMFLLITVVIVIFSLFFNSTIFVLAGIFGGLVGWFLLGYRYYKNRILEWTFDKSLDRISYRKISPNYEEYKQFALSELLIVQYGISGRYVIGNYIAFILKNGKKIELHTGKNEECKRIGERLEEFLYIPMVTKRCLKIILTVFILISFTLGSFLIYNNETVWIGILVYISSLLFSIFIDSKL